MIGTAWLMELVGVSMALGAFLAGLLLADSEYRHELEAQIEPFKGLLLGLFFISVGMGANVGLLLSSPLIVLGLTLLLIAIKLPMLFLIGRTLGELNNRSALQLGLVLAAGGEFAFVVFKIGSAQGAVRGRAVRHADVDHHLVDGDHAVAVHCSGALDQTQRSNLSRCRKSTAISRPTNHGW